jgi:hypothetical protein
MSSLKKELIFLIPAVAGDSQTCRLHLHHSITNPITTKRHVVAELSDSPPDVSGMRVLSERERDDTVTEDNHVKVYWLHESLAGLVNLVKCPETDKIVLLEQLDFLS